MVIGIVYIVLSFVASYAFGIVFHIRKEDLVLAGIGGAVVRTFIVVGPTVISSHTLIIFVAALVAGLYGGVLARFYKAPSAYFVYPSLIPLIPGDLLHYALSSLLIRNMESFIQQGLNCLATLLALALGLLVGSALAALCKPLIRVLRPQ